MDALVDWLLAASESEIIAATWVIVALGFAVAVLKRRDSPLRIRRAPYLLAFSAANFGAAAAFGVLSTTALDAHLAGALSVYLLAFVAIAAVCGFVYGLICVARARDGFASIGWAFLGLAPLLNLVLLFSPSRPDPQGESRPTPAGVVAACVIGGIALAVAGSAVTDQMERRIDADMARFVNDEDAYLQWVEREVDRMGVERFFAREAAATRPERLPNGVEIVRAEARDRRLRVHYRLPAGVVADRGRLRADLCAERFTRLMISKDATLEYVYTASTGAETTVSFGPGDCP